MFAATFEEAKTALLGFVPRAGSFYAKERNYDRGPSDRNNVSLLSPAIQRRILTEKEVIQEVLKHHSFEASEKFIQEVLWRSYWKSWLELRPSVWKDYLEKTKQLPNSAVYLKAVNGQTGIECFDEWRKELRETGYLHNHARMWFASIWIFTLNLPWYLGAKLFEDELIDFDPASNTLSWRWVAGLHTPGKNYVARAENIHTFTEGRFNPENQLNEKSSSPSFSVVRIEKNSETFSPAQPLPGKWGLLVHSEDLSLERTELVKWPIRAVALWSRSTPKTPVLRDFELRAKKDTLNRLGENFSCPVEELPSERLEAILDWSQKMKLEGICLVKPWQGPYLELLKLPLSVQYFRRSYDVPFLGKAKAGFFPFKEEMKKIIVKLNGENDQGLEKICLMNLKK